MFNKFKILTPSGYKHFKDIIFKGKQLCKKIILQSGQVILGTYEHIFYDENNTEKQLKDFKIGDKIKCLDNIDEIVNIEENIKENVYDIIDVEGGNKFIIENDIITHNCQFMGESDTLIDAMRLKELTNSIRYNQPLYKINEVKFYKELEANKKYIISIDFAIGVGQDYTSLNIFEFPGFIQIAEWNENRLNINEQAKLIYNFIWDFYEKVEKIDNKDPVIVWSFENNTWAEGFISVIREKGGFGIFPIRLISDDKRDGIATTKTSRSIATNKLKTLIESDRLKINSPLLVEQLNFFVKYKDKYQAKVGQHDDCVTSTMIAILVYLKVKDLFENSYQEIKQEKTKIKNGFLILK